MSTPVASPDNVPNASPTVREFQLITNKPSKGGDENGDHEIESGEDGEEKLRASKKRKCTSKGWGVLKEASLENGAAKADCVCHSHRLSLGKNRSTTPLNKHLTSCFEKNVLEKPTASQQDHEEIREIISHMAIMHELPLGLAESKLFNRLMGTIAPQYKGISSGWARKDCQASYGSEKEEVMTDLYNVNRVSVFTDLWKSGNEVLYMVVSCQYLDFDLNLQKRILKFCIVPPPHSGVELSNLLHECLVEWEIEKKVWTVTVDNATCNGAAVWILKENLLLKNNLPINGKFFHVRCFAQTLNLMAQDALSAISGAVSKVRASVKYVAASEIRIKTFSEIAKGLEIHSSKLFLDRCTRWNTTVSMLSVALDFKDVFSKYQEQDPLYDVLPSEEEWEHVRLVCSFLKQFLQLDHLKPGVKCLTSELVSREYFCLKKLLTVIDVGEDTRMIDMVSKMKARLDEYWGDCNLLMCVAAVLDPRYKMMLIDFCYEDIYSNDQLAELKNTVLETLHLLYNEYAKADEANKAKTKSSSDVEEHCYTSSLRRILGDDYIKYLDSQPKKSELDRYLDENSYVEKGTNAISWWKKQNYRFTILPKMAYDVLSIPMTTVVSESAFEAGSKVIDPHYASLGANSMRVLLCGGDWLRTRLEIKEKAKEYEGIHEINLR